MSAPGSTGRSDCIAASTRSCSAMVRTRTSTANEPAAGTVLNAGAQTLRVTFTPDDLTNWEAVTVTATLQVNKMTPTMTVSVGTYTYDKQPHPAAVTITGANGEALSPTQVSYNSSQTPPVNAGSYWVTAYYGGSANYNSTSKTSQPSGRK